MRRLTRDFLTILTLFLLVILTPGSRVPVLPIPIPLPCDGGLLIPMPCWQQIHEGPQIKPDGPPPQCPTRGLSATGDQPIPVTGSGH